MKLNPGPKVLMAHSLGCLLVSQWTQSFRDPGIKGAFLAAPPDIQSESFPKEAAGFKPFIQSKFPFPSVIVASRNDPYATYEFSGHLAEQWGSKLVDVGEKGHINLQSNLGEWEEGFQLFKSYYESLR